MWAKANVFILNLLRKSITIIIIWLYCWVQPFIVILCLWLNIFAEYANKLVHRLRSVLFSHFCLFLGFLCDYLESCKKHVSSHVIFQRFIFFGFLFVRSLFTRSTIMEVDVRRECCNMCWFISYVYSSCRIHCYSPKKNTNFCITCIKSLLMFSISLSSVHVCPSHSTHFIFFTPFFHPF